MRPSRVGWVLALAALSLAAASIGHRFRYDLALQAFLSRAPGLVAMLAFAALFAYAAHRWSRGDAERRLLLYSALLGTAFVLGLVIAIYREGWLGGSLFRAPLPIVLVVYTPHLFALALAPLALYRVIAFARPKLALAIFLAWVVLFSLVTIPVEHGFVARGIMIFQRDYTMREDILWGALFYCFELAVYLGLRARADNSERAR